MIAALDLGLIYALMALGVYLTFRILDFADLTIDSSFTTGAATCAVLIVGGVSPWLATVAGFGVGLVAGFVTGLLNTVGKIHPLLAGILTQIGLWSVNLRIMGKANVSLLGADTVFSPLANGNLLGTWVSVGILAAFVSIFGVALTWFLSTNLGLSLRATGDNEEMSHAQGINSNTAKLIGLALSNGLVSLSGALFCQYNGFADISMGVGLIIAGLASVIIGTAVVPTGRVWVAVVAVIAGSIVYRLIIQAALMIPGFDANDMKLLSAVIVVIALIAPRWKNFRLFKSNDPKAEFGEVQPWDMADAEELDSGDTRPADKNLTKRTKRKGA
ncbi:MAG: ABC transporter permease [Mobiluncus porci]|uniref:ABC transporter permease n=1 Tax=Mobiluncus porci TaxID=2652278 RepID=A0A7K0K2D0_9ACTO|nr:MULTISPECIES: ABC transporter permease [Mobiluncus]MCI6583935.1 ABC transporter permease [Mobiluncus sp.]MDD7542378.1 ABC transporter permease [Mobiluncus porci]MDY5747687.1 ABC transporter permease [Mobiluncus porci]MST49631.1 ABC transporter permease [Mobiluncus porci]